MPATIHTDICVIGAGAGGLSVAAGASQMGAGTVLIERHAMGGDCLNTGCVPSKALLAAAHAAHDVTAAARFGVHAGPPVIDWQKVHTHVHKVIAAIAPHDSQERFEGLGVRVIRAEARFVSPHEVAAGEFRIQARRFVIATGSAPAIPPIPGIDRVPFFTNETIFTNTAPLPHLLVIGGGPIGLEMAQAHLRLGSRVTVLEKNALLPRDDPEHGAILRQCLEAEGMAFALGIDILGVETEGGGVTVTYRRNGEEQRATGSHLLVATGRKPVLDPLHLDAAGVAFTPRGITVDARLRTSNPRIFALGDVAGPYLFTHVAGYQAGIVLRNALFRLPARVDYRAVPWVTYTDPEVAQVGLTEAMARERGVLVKTLVKPFRENDRARAEARTEGQIKVMVGKGGRILGASIVGAHAGELLQPWVLALSQGLKIGAMAGLIAPYPTLGELNKGVAGSWYTDSLFSPRVKALVRFLARFR